MPDHLQFKPSKTEVHLAAVLNGCRSEQACPDASAIAREIRNHGIDGLASAAPELWPADLSSELCQQALAIQFWEDQHKQLVSGLMETFASVDVPAMLIKGTACAYSVYSQPWTRTRGDSDVVIDPKHRAKAISALLDLGYKRDLSFSEEAVVGQSSFERVESGPGFSHVIDLHWQFSNSAVLSRMVSPAELLARAVPLPRLCEQAMGADPADALLIACYHRYVHRTSPYTIDQTQLFSENRLIWLMDIHLLSQRLESKQWDTFTQRALDWGLSNVCVSGLVAAQTLYATQIPDGVFSSLCDSSTVSDAERYLLATRTGRFWRDFQARPGLNGKATFLHAHLFPPAVYMRSRFEAYLQEPLVFLYLRRFWQGVMRRLRPSSAG